MAKRRSVEIGILGLLHGVSHLYQAALPPLYLLIQKEFSISFVELGLIGSVFMITGILQGVAGYFVDKFGRKLLTMIGMLVYTVAVFAFSLSPSFLLLLAFVLVGGLGSTTFHPATYSLITMRATKEHLGKSMAYHQFGGFLGGAFGTAFAAYLASYLGWRATLQIIPIVGLIVMLLFWLMVKEEKSASRNLRENVNDEGTFRITTPLLIIILVAFVGSLGGTGAYLPAFLSKAYGESTAWAGFLAGIVEAVGCASLLIGGVFADKFDKFSIVSVSYILHGISIVALAMGYFPSEVLLLLLIFVGFARYFGSAVIHALTSMASSQFGSGRAIGLEFAAFSSGGVIQSLLMGYIIDLYDIRSAFAVGSVFLFIAGIVLFLLGKRNKAA